MNDTAATPRQNPPRPSAFGLASLAIALELAILLGAGSAKLLPDPEVQAAIGTVARARNTKDLRAALQPLRAIEDPEHERLIPQLVFALRQAKDATSAMAAGIIVQELSITPSQLRHALEPLRHSGDAELDRQIDNLLGEEGHRSRPTEVRTIPPPTAPK